DRVRLAVEARRRERLERTLEPDRPAGDALLAGELAQEPLDRHRRGLAVEADRREAAHVAGEAAACLRLLVLGHEQCRLALPRYDRQAEPADLYPVAGREQDVLRQPQEDRLDALPGHRGLQLLDPRHAGTCSSTWRMPATTSSTCGSTSRSSVEAYGIGVSLAVTRTGAARSASHAASTTRATTSLAKPPARAPSLTTTSRPVFRMDASIASRSSGFSVRTSITSSSMASRASCRPACSARWTPCPYATTVASVPSRFTSATPSGTVYSPSGTGPRRP